MPICQALQACCGQAAVMEGSTVICTYRDLWDRSKLCALALTELGVKHGDVVATLAWNTTRHMEAWYGIMGLGAVCHTLNPRLSAKDIAWIANHGRDTWIMADATFLPLLEQILPLCPSVRGVILLTDRQHMPRAAPVDRPCLCYEALLDAQVERLAAFQWPELDENTPCGLCYTSGTTGNPKGVMYTHRSNLLHAMITIMPDALALGSSTTMLMVVPQFHANSWGIAFAAPMVGCRLVLPGPHLDGENVYHMIEAHGVTISAGVPTVWANLLAHVERHGLRFSRLKAIVIGGAAAPRSHIAAFEDRGVEVRHMWGMTELSPLGSLGLPKYSQVEGGLSEAELRDLKLAQGRPHAFCDMRIVDDSGRELAHDGTSVGHLQVRGPIVVERYHRQDRPATTGGRWFDTGDVASIDTLGFMRITDRSKDVIKSGGEWISSIALENAALGHPKVQEAAVIGVPHPKWDERPLLVAVPKPGAAPDDALRRDVLAFMASHPDVAKFAVPDDVLFVEAIPYGATGKASLGCQISKVALRAMVAQQSQQQPQRHLSKL
ncbi:fatty-acyl-CoA synthase [Monoraphidium neglectum]|uniref:Fatty-acyl-CoA synthase n=1 Tax=Monoraphidium neglectum TaxID=145388 RepID=A0A0D2MT24_9CHLO|nr:fatty-acyl-CoA synthase [Monoraphidium neglectum]KIZ05685.1 fatty-acyl-CoA synthase [Monoraphidium neglectum]|eukprot:XP_013904704.1 fatty-acyl-CoA synthase [Monoraphidium neglectum]